MKKFLAVVLSLFMFSAVYARDLAFWKNENVLVVFTDESCKMDVIKDKFPETHRAVVTLADGTKIEGCWRMNPNDDTKVQIVDEANQAGEIELDAITEIRDSA